MKRVRINAGRVGLVYRNGDYRRVLRAGVHWVSFMDTVVTCDLARPFKPATELEVLLRDETLASMLHVINVKDTELVILFESGVFQAVLTPGRYAFWKGLKDYSFITADISKVDITEPINVDVIKRTELVPFVRVCKVESFEKGILFVGNKADRVLSAGEYYFWKNARAVSVLKADLRTQGLEVSGQDILTRDKTPLRVNFSALYMVTDIQKALIENRDYEKQLYVLIQLALREYISGFTLDELLERKDEIQASVMRIVHERAEALGVKIRSCGLKDIILPGEVKDILSQVLVAQKRAEANVITRREETASTRSLLNTARLMEDNNMLFKLKEMEYVEKIADKISSISLSGGNRVLDQLRDIFTTSE